MSNQEKELAPGGLFFIVGKGVSDKRRAQHKRSAAYWKNGRKVRKGSEEGEKITQRLNGVE